MKGNLKKEASWTEFRKIFSCISTNEDELHSSLIKLIPALDNFLQLAPSIIFIIDYSTMHYLYFNENINDFIGDAAKDYIKEGIEFSLSQVHPEDREILVTQLFPHIKNFLNKVAPEKYKDYKFSFNFRYKRADGTYQHFIQHSTYLPDKAGNLRYNFGLGNNIPNADKIKLSLTIEKKEKGSYRQVYIDEVNAKLQTIFTQREIEVLDLICQGYSSTAIADKLFLSEHTVNNHRKKMLQKSGITNTAALISYAFENKLI